MTEGAPPPQRRNRNAGMGIDSVAPPAGPVVAAIAGHGFRVGQIVHDGGLKLTPEAAIGWQAPRLDALTIDDLTPLLDGDPAPEFLLLGTGLTLRRPANDLVRVIEAKGIGIEFMDSRAAARAWGLLRSEGRAIVAALLPLG
ncbi:MAG: MTH938/NDUFAF3 family protein [Sphingomonas fennica]